LVFDGEFLPGDTALIVPKTRDGRVIFAIPWHNHAVVGTTDTPRADTPVEPRPLPGEVEFLLETIAPYLTRKPQHSDIRSVFAGIRPLVRGGNVSQTSKLGRDHEVRVSPTGMISVLGGKWTTYRKMAEDCVDKAARLARLKPQASPTKSLRIHGHPSGQRMQECNEYGSDASGLRQLIDSIPDAGEFLAERLPIVAGQAIYAALHEMARTVEDVLARRTRALFLDAESAIAAAPRVAALLAVELNRDSKWQAGQLDQFRLVAEAYRPNSAQ
jgi:glycerol-3-phosphate dehydrogenase